MASNRQIEANRGNAARSTGPKSKEGKLRSSRNSFRHGLSRPMTADGGGELRTEAPETFAGVP